MTTICQNVATLTTTTLRTIASVYRTTSTEQIAGRPTTSTIVDVSSVCSTATIGNSTTVRCATSSATRLTVIVPPPSQRQIILTISDQHVESQRNTLFGTLCTTVPAGVPPPALTDLTYTTEYVTVTGPDPSTPTTFRPTRTTGPSRTPLSQSTVYGGDPTSESSPSDTALGAGSDQSGSSTVPVGAIVGGVVGGLVAVALLAFLAYYLLFKKPIAAKGYKAPGEASPYLDSEQSDVFSSEQTGYYPQGHEGQGYTDGQQQNFGVQQLQSGPTQPQGSYPMQYTDMGGQGAQHLQPQDVGGGNMYPEQPQGHYLSQTEMGQVPFNSTAGAISGYSAAAAAGATIPVVAAASHRFSSSSSPPPGSTIGQYSPDSHVSAIPLIQHGSYQPHTPVPYRGYAEPAEG